MSDLVVRTWERGQQIVPEHSVFADLLPVEFHFKLDGACPDKHAHTRHCPGAPMMAIVMVTSSGSAIVGQVSFKMLEPVFAEMDRIRGVEILTPQMKDDMRVVCNALTLQTAAPALAAAMRVLAKVRQ